jgi:hypothetical protein
MKSILRNGLLVTVLSFALATSAQHKPVSSEGPQFTAQGTFAAFVVTDLDASLHWYQSNLGLRVIKRGTSPRVAAETVVLGGDVFIALCQQVVNQC